MIKQFFVFLLLIIQTFASYQCKTPQTCQVQCKNYDFFQLKKLDNTLEVFIEEILDQNKLRLKNSPQNL